MTIHKVAIHQVTIHEVGIHPQLRTLCAPCCDSAIAVGALTLSRDTPRDSGSIVGSCPSSSIREVPNHKQRLCELVGTLLGAEIDAHIMQLYIHSHAHCAPCCGKANSIQLQSKIMTVTPGELRIGIAGNAQKTLTVPVAFYSDDLFVHVLQSPFGGHLYMECHLMVGSPVEACRTVLLR